MTSKTESVWPAKLSIRDTGIHDDMGGGGQRIYTTAGRGYETREYILADSAVESAKQTTGLRMICYHGGCQYMEMQEETKRLRDRLERMRGLATRLQQQLGSIIDSLNEVRS